MPLSNETKLGALQMGKVIKISTRTVRKIFPKQIPRIIQN